MTSKSEALICNSLVCGLAPWFTKHQLSEKKEGVGDGNQTTILLIFLSLNCVSKVTSSLPCHNLDFGVDGRVDDGESKQSRDARVSWLIVKEYPPSLLPSSDDLVIINEGFPMAMLLGFGDPPVPTHSLLLRYSLVVSLSLLSRRYISYPSTRDYNN